MRRVHIVTLICLLISLALAGGFALNYEEGTLATAQIAFSANEVPPAAGLSLETIEKTNLIGMGIILGAVVFVTIIAFYRKPAPSDEEI